MHRDICVSVRVRPAQPSQHGDQPDLRPMYMAKERLVTSPPPPPPNSGKQGKPLAGTHCPLGGCAAVFECLHRQDQHLEQLPAHQDARVRPPSPLGTLTFLAQPQENRLLTQMVPNFIAVPISYTLSSIARLDIDQPVSRFISNQGTVHYCPLQLLALKLTASESSKWHSHGGQIAGQAPSEEIDRLTLKIDDNSDMASDVGGGGELVGANGVHQDFFDDVTNKALLPDSTSQWLTRFEKGEDVHIQQTFIKAKRAQFKVAPTPFVGLVVLPGADKPTVARLEESNMTDKRPDQRDSTYRVNTAGSLLESWTVNKDLSFRNEDNTFKVVDGIKVRNRDGKISIPEYSKDTVTIDSQQVEIVDELRKRYDGRPEYDLCATLIEVDAGSLVKLITNFRKLVSQSSRDPTHDRDNLENMMEDTRTFCARSPILFRAGTRNRVIDAVNIRYGIDDEQGFRTIYTSRGIQQLISVSASYFNALDPTTRSANDMTQTMVRPRFLQTLCLLLSMLSNVDIRQMSDFLDATYGITADRPNIEILFLKVIPLASINSKVFLSSVVPAVLGYKVDKKAIEDEAQCWETLLKKLAEKGYLLPGTVDDLGRNEHSWLYQWPTKDEDRIRSSHIFGRLQLHGENLRGFNEILTVKVGTESDEKELTIYLQYFPDRAFSIAASDYEHLHCLDPREYILQDTAEEANGRVCKVTICSKPLNDLSNEAVRLINRILPTINREVVRRGGSKLTKWAGRKGSNGDPGIIAGDLQIAPTITRHEAWLEGVSAPLAVTWKCDGRTISKVDMLRRMGRSIDRIKIVVEKFLRGRNHRLGKSYDSDEREATYASQVQECLAREDEILRREETTRAAPDTPIARSVHPGDDISVVRSKIWFEYKSQYRPDRDQLFVWAQSDTITGVKWLRGGSQAEIMLRGIPTKFIVAALRPELMIPQEDEVVQGDMVLLAGKYMIVTSLASGPASYEGPRQLPHYEMTNWLEIQSIDEQAQSRRRKNKIGHRSRLRLCQDLSNPVAYMIVVYGKPDLVSTSPESWTFNSPAVHAETHINPHTPTKMTKHYEIKVLPGKGNAMVAVHPPAPGTVIVRMSGDGRSAITLGKEMKTGFLVTHEEVLESTG
ncbi:uncharacterized protein MYCFIDRAFT_179218 [Pseudocercospora fijiensis CIRAD86]|uniref:Uncharacterized protein n=1 Tax=Pseudocercospora fijiensis (strain CIRAD86) TaxID=383855 RepID=M2ZZZ1_PSEFD|nr:uncharacterized protein MYCFIDRAFT_179218 [Pseudocercospora fijiensis CIRAD86]EME77721.1 hypothetical protein MYCFIDRAFT_179218 [Pseudocercospora fijiensis CIRAD86]